MALENKSQRLKEFGIYLRMLRKAKGLSIRELAAHCDIDNANIGEIERGEREPRLSTLLQLADALGQDLLLRHHE